MLNLIKAILNANKNAQTLEVLKAEHNRRTPEVFYAFSEGVLFPERFDK